MNIDQFKVELDYTRKAIEQLHNEDKIAEYEYDAVKESLDIVGEKLTDALRTYNTSLLEEAYKEFKLVDTVKNMFYARSSGRKFK